MFVFYYGLCINFWGSLCWIFGILAAGRLYLPLTWFDEVELERDLRAPTDAVAASALLAGADVLVEEHVAGPELTGEHQRQRLESVFIQ